MIKKNESKKIKIPIILGPTCSGKTSLAINLAKYSDAQIISADSRQVYKNLNIGTGKNPINAPYSVLKNNDFWILDGIKIWGYDLVNIGDFFSGYDYCVFALNKIRQLLNNNIKVFIVGGTGFYIDLITKRTIFSNIEPDFELRKKLSTYSLEELQMYYKDLTSLNVDNENNIDLRNPVRLIRAIEKLIARKKNFSTLPYFTNVEFVFIGLKSENNFLYQRSDQWVENIWNNGLLDEVKSLIEMGYLNTLQLNGIVYKTAVKYLLQNDPHTQFSKAQAVQILKYNMHSYIRRQLTYFKKNSDIIWFDISSGDYIKNIYNLIYG